MEFKTWEEKVALFGKPIRGKVYTCVAKGFTSGKEEVCELLCVDEDDVLWRFADDGSEFNEMGFDVVSWKAKE